MVALVVGTIGSFAAMVLATKNQSQEAADQQQAYEAYQQSYAEYQQKLDAQSDELSNKYYKTFSAYESSVKPFDMDGVSKLATKDIVKGDGKTIEGSTPFAAYYIGWLPSGKVFDQSIDTEAKKLKSPLPVETGLANASLIEGWKTGMQGMKIGGVREITIPSDQAYGESGSTDASGKEVIPANTPLKFIVMAIPLPEQIPQPEVPASLYQNF